MESYLLPVEHYVWQFGLEFLLVLISVVWAFWGPAHTPGWLKKSIRPVLHIASKPAWGVFVIFSIALFARWATLSIDPVPHPVIHDEFCYLLQSDTFASGKMTNPTHPMWMFFESMHIFHSPTYQAKYPPLHGLVMAMGQAFLGHPWYALWISCALMCGVLCWAFYGWVPRKWAFFGGFLCVLQLGLFNYWCSSYWGGSVAAIGGALVLGALGRILKNPKMVHGFLLGMGLAILANTRPYEGLLLALPVGFFVIRKILELYVLEKRKAILSLLLPLLMVLILSGFATMSYFKKVTGSPFQMPYGLHQELYETYNPFVWQKDNPKLKYNHQKLREYWIDHYKEKWGFPIKLTNFLSAKAFQILYVGAFYLGICLLPPLLFLPQVFHDKSVYPLLGIGVFCLLGHVCQKSVQPHYIAPQAVLLFTLLIQSMRHMKVWRRQAPSRPGTGRRLVVAVGFSCFLVFLGDVVLNKIGLNTVYLYTSDFGKTRSEIIKQLENIPGNHLVIVRDAPNHCIIIEWVYNHADIDNSKIVWARDMGHEKNREILEYFRNRTVWMLEGDEQSPKLAIFEGNR